tara:strand:- start:566 stop:682 length:117 start_codon:yes stop_codon:yes gene_type:complete
MNSTIPNVFALVPDVFVFILGYLELIKEFTVAYEMKLG